MKIGLSFLTIALIMLSIIVTIDYLAEKSSYDSADDFCNALRPADLESASLSELSEYYRCFSDNSYLLTRTGYKLYASITLVLLAILSWKVDMIMKGKK